MINTEKCKSFGNNNHFIHAMQINIAKLIRFYINTVYWLVVTLKVIIFNTILTHVFIPLIYTTIINTFIHAYIETYVFCKCK